MVMISKHDGTFVLSPSDLTSSAACEFAWMRNVDVKLGRIPREELSEDAMLARTAKLGLTHEAIELARLVETHGTGVVQMPNLAPYTRKNLAAAHEQTVAHLRSGVDAVFQAAFFDGSFAGLADFIVKGNSGTYEVRDTKLARHAKVSALLQIAAYAHQLDLEAIPRSSIGKLILGDGTVFEQDLTEIIPVYLERRKKLEAVLSEHIAESSVVEWNDPRYLFCGTCDTCTSEIDIHRDLLLVAGMRKTQRAKLRAARIETIEQLAGSSDHVDTLNPSVLETLRAQARLQVAPPTVVESRELPAFEILDAGKAIHNLPAPSAGDLFFDFEGDPLWSDHSGSDWGLEYLFGLVEPVGAGLFTPLWAHDRAGERAALIAFLDIVQKRRAERPDMHVYHYASYEVTALKRLVGRYGVYEDVLDDMLRNGIFVDLYQTVRQGLRVGTPSYSIKMLEPLYMGTEYRTGLDNAADSMVEYQIYTDQVLAGDDTKAALTLDGIAGYNRYDCLSTWRLRDWLLDQIDHAGDDAANRGKRPDQPEDGGPEAPIDVFAPVVDALLTHAGEPGKRTNDEQAVAMIAATLGYHRREHKPFWWAFFDRLVSWPGDWLEPRDCMHSSRVEVLSDWTQDGKKLPTRVLRLIGRLEPGSNLTVGTSIKGIYDDIPIGFTAPEEGGRCVGGSAEIEDVSATLDGLDVLIVREHKPRAVADQWSELPIGVCIPSPIRTRAIEDALLEIGRNVSNGLPSWPRSAGLDIIRRLPPRFSNGGLVLADVATEDAIYDSVKSLDRSYLAVQGPPGTGKTRLGSRVIKKLVTEGWRVGVVAQSHAVVENFFRATIDAGLSADLIAKPLAGDDDPWADCNGDKLLKFINDHPSGCLVGGTAWTFSSRTNVGFEQLDLLVIDEAGQFALANTLAVSSATQRLLLLGDPQQLPQVSQGTHPEPVDSSALEWIANGDATLRPEFGYFLARTWRMHSELTQSVSQLSYAGRLISEVEVTDARELTGVPPGIHVLTVEHARNDVRSVEESAAIVDLVRGLMGKSWTAGIDEPPRPLQAVDLLVVAPYNAQRALLRHDLDLAGFAETRVGTVDKFQGQEAPVVIISMTASSAENVPRGIDFLLNRNRLNVAVSRGQWAAYIVQSRTLTDFLPTSPHALGELGAYITLGRS